MFDSLRVLDFTRYLPAPLVGLYLADHGAQVFKVEPHPHGDPHRQHALFALVHRGKKFLSVDFTDLARVLPAWVSKTDILIENFRPSTAAKLGLEPNVLLRYNPQLIYVRITGYGSAHDVPGHDLNFLAQAGLITQPPLPAFLIADLVGGTAFPLIRLMQALWLREKTHKGTFLDLSITQETLRLGYHFLHLHHLGTQIDFTSGIFPCYRLYATADKRYIAVAALEPKFWEAFCHAIDKPELIPHAFSLEKEIHQVVENVFLSQPYAHWEKKFAGNTFCVTPLRSFEEALTHFSEVVSWHQGKPYLTFGPHAKFELPPVGAHNSLWTS
ncbi:MAG: CoA transferase [Bacteroidia bacterium]